MAHVAFCIAPFTGHVNPSLAIVSELARRGHRVSYATTAQFAAAAQAAGGQVVTYETSAMLPPGGRPARHETTGAELAHAWRGQLRELEAVTPVLVRAFGDDVPDAVVCDPMSWPGPVLAARWHVPSVTSVTSMISDARWSLGPVGAKFNPADPAFPRLFAAVSAALARYESGLTADRLLGSDDGTPVIAYYPRAFQRRGDQFGSHVWFAGPCLPGRPEAVPRAPAGREARRAQPLVLVSLGTVFNRQPALFRRCIDAFAGLDYQVVAALGGMDPAELGPLPGNTSAHAYVPLTQVLPQAAVLVGHGGMTSTMEALSHGVPIVALPQMPEQRVNAERLTELGLGAHLEPARQTGPPLRETVAAVLHDAGLRSRLDWMRAEIGRAPGAPAVAEVIENMMRRCHRGGAGTYANA
ncbi:MAG TPA: macrolide family glycosyltransferase [Streptosporangiaceae bacterium]|jgi:demethyllactenocin mycarosyltransferase